MRIKLVEAQVKIVDDKGLFVRYEDPQLFIGIVEDSGATRYYDLNWIQSAPGLTDNQISYQNHQFIGKIDV